MMSSTWLHLSSSKLLRYQKVCFCSQQQWRPGLDFDSKNKIWWPSEVSHNWFLSRPMPVWSLKLRCFATCQKILWCLVFENSGKTRRSCWKIEKFVFWSLILISKRIGLVTDFFTYLANDWLWCTPSISLNDFLKMKVFLVIQIGDSNTLSLLKRFCFSRA